MRGHSKYLAVPLGVPLVAAVATWLVENFTEIQTVTVWLPNQKTRAGLVKELAGLGVRRLPRLRLLRAEEPDIAAPAPHVLSPAALCATVASVSDFDAQMMQTNALVSLYGAQLSQGSAAWAEASPTARRLRQVFNALDTTLHRTGYGTLAHATLDSLKIAADAPGPQVVAGLLDAHGAALDFLRALAARDDSTFIFPALPLPTPPVLASHPGSALLHLLNALNITGLENLPGTPTPYLATPQLCVAPHPLAEAAGIAHAARQAIEAGQVPVHILCPDAGLRDLVAATLRTYGLAYQGEGPRLSRTPAGQLLLALLRAAAAPGPPALATLSRALNLTPLLDHLLWRGTAAESWDDWGAKLGALTHDEVSDIDRPLLAAGFGALRDLLLPLAEPRVLTEWLNDLFVTLTSARPDFDSLPGAATLRRWAAEGARAPAPQHWPVAKLADFVAQQCEVHCLPASTTGDIVLTGLLEARLLHAGTVIIAGANEGVWPATANAPLLGDADADRLGLPGPRQQLRLTSAEFHLALHAAPHVVISRSATDAQGVTRPSRFLQNVTTRPLAPVTLAVPPFAPLPQAGVFVPDEKLLAPDWSASWVEDLAQCPYRALGKRRLKLDEAEPYFADPTAEHHGLWVHRWLGEFWPAWQKQTIDDAPTAEALLLKLGQRELARQPEVIRRLWQNRLRLLAAQMVRHWQGRQVIHTEVKLEGQAGNKALTARADRIDATAEGWRLVDYKTGGVPTWPQVKRGEKPQLLVEAELARQNGQQVEGVEYVRLHSHGAKLVDSKPQRAEQLRDALDQTGPWLAQLAGRYAPEKTYPAAPVYGGGLAPRGHCERCGLSGVCRWQEAVPPEVPHA